MRGQLRGLEAACAGEMHAALVARLATLETEHAALARDADAQRRQYERCLDDVANQVVRALLSQKVHRYALITILSFSLFLILSLFVLFECPCPLQRRCALCECYYVYKMLKNLCTNFEIIIWKVSQEKFLQV